MTRYYLIFTPVLLCLALFCSCQREELDINADIGNDLINTETDSKETEARETNTETLFATDFEARKAIYGMLNFPMNSTYYSDESVSAFRELTQKINLSINNVTAENASEWISEIYAGISALEFISGDIYRVYISNSDDRVHNSYHPAAIAAVATDGTTVCENEAQIKLRGNSTRDAEKSPYTIKYTDKQSLAGMGKGRR